MTSRSRVLFVVMALATMGALVWLPALVGFGGAVGLASLWCWHLDPRSAESSSAQAEENIRGAIMPNQ